MLDKTITSALINLRRQIIRGKLDGLPHIDALLVQRGIDPAAHRVGQPMPSDRCRSGEVRVIILEALRSGPKRPSEIGAAFMARKPDIPRDRAMIRVYRAIYKMRDQGTVAGSDGMWRLVP